MLKFSSLNSIVSGSTIQMAKDEAIQYLITDSRKVLASPKSLFFAIKGVRNDGHEFIASLYHQGVRQFIVERKPELANYPNGNFYLVESAITALQKIAAHHRAQFNYPVVGITGSNGKTIVKEWVYQLLSPEKKCVKNPGSYNSQIGVPLSVWQMTEDHELGIFEAGISQPDEMASLQKIIQPTIGIFTNIGSAHAEGFNSIQEKASEKANLFKDAETVIYCSDYPEIEEQFAAKSRLSQKLLAWGQKPGSNILLEFTNDKIIQISGALGNHRFALPFQDFASKENLIHCIVLLIHLGCSDEVIDSKINQLHSVPMRLELKQGINKCQIINDAYNNDLGGLRISLDFLSGLNKPKRTLILSDVLQSGLTLEDLAAQIAEVVRDTGIQKFIGIGFGFYSHHSPFDQLDIDKQFFLTTDDFIRDIIWNDFQDEAILVKGARVFEFEKVVQRLQKKVHGTVMEIDMNSVVHNLNYFRSLLQPGVKLMVMVKAFAYGSGSQEIASLLQYHRVDYLGVAYVDEGVELRQHHIHLPIMVMNPTEDTFQALIDNNLEPEIYSLSLLKSLVSFLNGRPIAIHLKVDTGMHRLGLEQDDIAEALDLLSSNSNIQVASVFSHLAASDEAKHDEFTVAQSNVFEKTTQKLEKALNYSPLRHILNSGGILRHPGLQYDMVRLGIGLYGIDPSGELQDKLEPVATLKTVISQVKTINKGETVGYGRRGKAERELRIATIAIGYADGYNRAFSNGIGCVLIAGKRARVIGNVCMDMTMVDVTEIPEALDGSEVILFGQELPIPEVAQMINTIPYEILTNTSERVKRVFYAESL